MVARPSFIYAPTLDQLQIVFRLVRKGRKIVSKGELTPDDAVELRHLMNLAEREFQLAFGNDNDKPDPEFDHFLVVMNEHLNREEPFHA